MADHDCLGRSGGSAGVDEGARVARPLPVDALLDLDVRDAVSKLANKIESTETSA